MAIRDHTAPARPSFPSGKAFSDPSDALLPASVPPSLSLHSITLDDVALALHVLNVVCHEDEQSHQALARHAPLAELPTLPFPASIREGLAVAMRCLGAYALQLEARRTANA